jgi:hypothetical protein
VEKFAPTVRGLTTVPDADTVVPRVTVAVAVCPCARSPSLEKRNRYAPIPSATRTITSPTLRRDLLDLRLLMAPMLREEPSRTLRALGELAGKPSADRADRGLEGRVTRTPGPA